MDKPLKDADLEEYFQALFAMYSTLGWTKILEDMTRMKDILKDAETIDNRDELWFRKGQLDIINQILTHRARSEAAYASALEEQEGTADEPTGGVAKVIA